MILVLGGTTEGRELALLLYEKGHSFLLSAATQLGVEQLSVPLDMRCGKLDEAGLIGLIDERDIKLVVDATHPFAAAASHNAMAACGRTGVSYLRLERPSVSIPQSEQVYTVDDFKAAAELAFDLGMRVLLTIGSRNLALFLKAAREKGGELVVRVLPQSVDECLALGMPSEHVITFSGVDSVEQNRSWFKSYGVDVVVCKESGRVGGTPQKISAALELGVQVVVISRPVINYPKVVDSAERVLEMIETNTE